jgi:hypothetical protein
MSEIRLQPNYKNVKLMTEREIPQATLVSLSLVSPDPGPGLLLLSKNNIIICLMVLQCRSITPDKSDRIEGSRHQIYK